MVSRVWRKFGIQPPSWAVSMASDDPGFEEKVADIIGLYIRRPVHVAAFCVDEKMLRPTTRSYGPRFPTFSRLRRWCPFSLQRFGHSKQKRCLHQRVHGTQARSLSIFSHRS